MFQGRFRYESTLILIQNHQREIEERYLFPRLLVVGEKLIRAVIQVLGDGIVFEARHFIGFDEILLLFGHIGVVKTIYTTKSGLQSIEIVKV